MPAPKIFPSASDPREIILIRYQGALHVGISKYPGLPTEEIARMLTKGEADGDVETRFVIGPMLDVPLGRSEKFYVFASVQRYFSREALFEPAPTPATRQKPGPRAQQHAEIKAVIDRMSPRDRRLPDKEFMQAFRNTSGAKPASESLWSDDTVLRVSGRRRPSRRRTAN